MKQDNEDLIRKHIASAVAKLIASGEEKIECYKFAEMERRRIPAGSMNRYIFRKPLFENNGEYLGHPVFRFLWMPKKFMDLGPCEDWNEVITSCFTEDVLDNWMRLYAKHLKTGKLDKVIKRTQDDNFSNALGKWRIEQWNVGRTTKQKIKYLNSQIRTYLNVVFGNKI
jgi:hypothetical protein